MREWDEMVARQVAADGVRTTWGEHMPAMTDDTRSILSADEVRSRTTPRPPSGRTAPTRGTVPPLS